MPYICISAYTQADNSGTFLNFTYSNHKRNDSIVIVHLSSDEPTQALRLFDRIQDSLRSLLVSPEIEPSVLSVLGEDEGAELRCKIDTSQYEAACSHIFTILSGHPTPAIGSFLTYEQARQTAQTRGDPLFSGAISFFNETSLDTTHYNQLRTISAE